MHKSALNFGLLASSLVMLGAIMPLLNNNTIAMAQGYDADYYDDNYSKSTQQKIKNCLSNWTIRRFLC